MTEKGDYRTLAGYRYVVGVPRCPCNDPGTYMTIEQSVSDPLALRFGCWCGRTLTGRADDAGDLARLLTANGIAS